MENFNIFDNLCANQKEKSICKKIRKYSFYQMLEEFENGYDGNFTADNFDNSIITYDRESKILLEETEKNIMPLTITTRLLSSDFIMRRIYIDNARALKVINSGGVANFEATFDEGIKYSGWYKIENNCPKYFLSIKNNDFSDEWFILNALFNGVWYV